MSKKFHLGPTVTGLMENMEPKNNNLNQNDQCTNHDIKIKIGTIHAPNKIRIVSAHIISQY